MYTYYYTVLFKRAGGRGKGLSSRVSAHKSNFISRVILLTIVGRRWNECLSLRKSRYAPAEQTLVYPRGEPA